MNPESEVTENTIKWFENPSHWTKNVMSVMGKDGRIVSTCLLGGLDHVTGISVASGMDRVQEILASVIREQFPERLECFSDPDAEDYIVSFNDDPNTVIADVRAVLEKTLAQLQEEG